MPPLPQISAREAVDAFEKVGFVLRRQRGSHMMMDKKGHPRTLAVPNQRELRTGTLRSLIRDAGLTVEEFIELLK